MRDIDDVIQHPDRDCGSTRDRLEINFGMGAERMFDELRQID